MDNKTYWAERMDNALKLSEKQVTMPLKKLYRKAFNNIKGELLNIWLDMAGEGEISQSALYQRNRMSNLQALLSKELKKLGETNIEYMQIGLFATFQNGYESMDNFLGLKGTFSFLDEQVANQIINQNYKDANFSERIWSDMDKLRTQIEDSVTKSALQGKDVRKVAKELQERMNVAYSSSKRITVTETGRIFNESCRQKAMDRGYTSYQFLAYEDEKTCEECMELDGKIFPLTDTEHMPPIHPNSRSTILIVVD
ncbi:minor capsid protein [Anaerotignum sp.]|uniref:minor capsid protein n=1 Tax=Anaerotignum sp. TaxID=2039241 RepID=UPI003325AB2D